MLVQSASQPSSLRASPSLCGSSAQSQRWFLFPCRSLVAGAGVCVRPRVLDNGAADGGDQERLLLHPGPVQTRVSAGV